MSPTCSKATMRVLIAVLLASSVANAAALPHEVVDARAPAPIQNAQLAAEAIQAAASAAAEDPTNFFEDISDELNHRTAWEVFRDFFTRLFGPREDDTPATVTVTVTPIPEAVSSAAAAVTSAIEALSSAIEAPSSVELILPPGPSEIVSSDILSTTSAPSSELIMSILPIGDLTTSINATTLPDIFSTAPEETPSATPIVIEITAPFPIMNATSTDGLLPTAVSITGEFSVMIPLVTDVPSPANSSLPEGTGVSLPNGTDLPLNSSLPLNATATVDSTTIVVVTETITPIPIGTAPVVVPIGTDPAVVSAGTGLPIVIVASPLWPNATYGEPTVAPVPSGTGLPLGTGASVPLGTGSAVVPLSTGVPLLTGTGSMPEDTALPIASPLYPNTTSSVSEALTLIVPVPILVTGVPDPVIVNVTIPAANATTEAAPEEPSVSVTAVPITVTGVPGAVLNVSVTIPVAPFANATTVAAEETAVLPVETSLAPAVSVGTGLPIPSLAPDASAPFANTTIVAVPTDAPVVIVIPEAPAVETPVVEPGQLNVTVSLTGDYSS